MTSVLFPLGWRWKQSPCTVVRVPEIERDVKRRGTDHRPLRPSIVEVWHRIAGTQMQRRDQQAMQSLKRITRQVKRKGKAQTVNQEIYAVKTAKKRVDRAMQVLPAASPEIYAWIACRDETSAENVS